MTKINTNMNFLKNTMIINYNLNNYLRDDQKYMDNFLRKSFQKEFGHCFNLQFILDKPHKIEVIKTNILISDVRMRAHRIKANRLLSEYVK